MADDLWILTKRQRYKARKVICVSCGKELIVFKNRPHCGYCQSCNAKRINPRVSDDELFVLEKNGIRRRIKKIKCSKCGKELILSKNRKTNGLCHYCAIYKNGIKGYRIKALKFFGKKCYCCGSIEEEKILVHHRDKNRKNNDILNLIPLCNSCHRSLHYRLRKGLTHEEAIEAIKAKKTPNPKTEGIS